MSAHRRSPRPISLALGRLSEDWAPDTLLAQAQRIWPTVVGEAIAAEAQPVHERAGVLTVACSASVWAQELDLMSSAILEPLNAGLRHGRVTKLRCLVQS